MRKSTIALLSVIAVVCIALILPQPDAIARALRPGEGPRILDMPIPAPATTKEVGFSYASSDNARRFKFPNGCYTVSTIEGMNPPEAVSGHATRDEALAAARLLPMPWNALFLRHNTDVQD